MKDVEPDSYVPSTPGTRQPSLDLYDLATDSEECDSSPLLDLEAAYRSSTGDSVFSRSGDTGSSIQ